MNYYEILGVQTTDSPEFIRKKYKQLARKYHPDTTTLDKEFAEQEFKKISVAYEHIKKGNTEPDVNYFTQKIIEKASRLAELFKKIDKNEVKDVFIKVFNNMTEPKDANEYTDYINVSTYCSIEDIYNCEQKAVTLVRNRRCKECLDNTLKFCEKCNNKDYCEESKIFTFNCNEKNIVFSGESNQKKNYLTGDVHFRVIPKNNDTYSIINDYNILMKLYVSQNKKEINHVWQYLDKKKYIFKAKADFSNNYTIKNLGLSIPGTNKRGDLIINISVKREDNNNFIFNQIE